MKRFFIGFTAVALITAMACKKDDPPAVTSGYPQGSAYPPATGYPTATAGYPTAQPTAYPTAAPAAGGMATPGPLALPCTSDAACGLAHCNVQFSKCAYPCANTAVDCVQGASCNPMTGLCLPGGS